MTSPAQSVELNPPQVVYERQVVSLSEAAKQVYGVGVQGPAYWAYEGELLTERRGRFEHYHCQQN